MSLFYYQNRWVPRRADQGPKTIEQIHKDAEQEEHREQMKVQQAMMANRTPSAPQDESWTTVPITTKSSRPIDAVRLSKITKAPVLDNQVLAPSSDTWGNWGKGSSGGSTTKPADAD
ncbi:hypothetical protein NHX12_000528 [Muraenolepis orangiensis]|uniref:Uncharacterized protein n=1 Tax=Muraenolepis orangiensis TaxID=630683 RepID=A0A9Q0D5L0_9TELE|nr:hypothetical protein NHX12_000528 [Muraenolepis orangiensis]